MWVSLCELAAENAFGVRRGGSVTRIADPVAWHDLAVSREDEG